jgi:hypothetical protein
MIGRRRRQKRSDGEKKFTLPREGASILSFYVELYIHTLKLLIFSF